MSGSVAPVNVVINEQINPSIVGNIRAIGQAAIDAEKHLQSLRTSITNIGAAQTQFTQAANAQTAATRAAAAATIPHAVGMNNIAHATNAASTGTARFKTELLVLAHELSQGRYTRFGGSLMVLAEYGNVAGRIFSVFGLTMIAVAAAIAVVIQAAERGSSEFARINNILNVTNGYAGITTGEFKKLAATLAGETHSRLSEAESILEKLALTGKFTGEALKGLTAISLDLARRTGEDADKIAQDFSKMSDGVTKFAIEHVSQFHDITAAQIDYVRQLELMGQKEKAEETLINDIHASIRQQGEAQIGALIKVWRGFMFAVDDAYEALKRIGRDNTLEERLAALQERLIAAKKDAAHPGSDAGDMARLAAIQNRIEFIKGEIELQREDARGKAAIAREQQAGVEASARMNDEWERFNKGAARAKLEVDKFRASLEAALKANPNDTASLAIKANQAAVEAAIRKRYDPIGTRIDRQAQAAEERREITLGKINLQLDNQLARVQMLRPERERAIAMDRIEEQLFGKKIKLEADERREIEAKIKAIKEAERNEAFAQRPREQAISQGEQFAAQIREQNLYIDNLMAMYARIDELRQADKLSEEEAARAKALANNLYLEQRLSYSQQFFGELAQLQNSSNKTLGAIGKAAAIAQATIDGILAVQKALASAPPPWNIAIAAAIGAVTAANVAQIAGIKFAAGGLVRGPGTGTSDSINARLSDHEFVVNAQSTRRFLPLLQAINDNRMPRFAAGGYVGTPNAVSMGGMNVQVHNHSSAQVSVRQLSPTDVAIMIREQAPQAVASDMDRPNSRVSKSLARNLNAPRKLG